jgi:hypothetical protein
MYGAPLNWSYEMDIRLLEEKERIKQYKRYLYANITRSHVTAVDEKNINKQSFLICAEKLKSEFKEKYNINVTYQEMKKRLDDLYFQLEVFNKPLQKEKVKKCLKCKKEFSTRDPQNKHLCDNCEIANKHISSNYNTKCFEAW